MISLVNKPMHARFSFHHSSLQLSFITQAWIFKLKLVLCKQTYEMHIQMHHTSLWACSPYLCAQNFNWSLSFVISLPLCQVLPLCCLFHYLRTLISLFFSPCTNITNIFVFLPLCHQWPQRFKMWIGWDLSMSMNEVRINFPNLIQSRSFVKDI